MTSPGKTVLIEELCNHDGSEVTLRGWVQAKRSGGKIIFIQLRDGTGICQCIVEKMAEDAFAAAGELTQEFSLSVTGLIRKEDRAPGGYEMSITSLEMIGVSEDYPISRKAHGVDFR